MPTTTRSRSSKTKSPASEQTALQAPQEPRLLVGPAWDWTEGDAVIELASSFGLVLDPWQQEFVKAVTRRSYLPLEIRRTRGMDASRWSAFEAAQLVARQNGKGGELEALEMGGLFLFGDELILHSAHEFKTAQEAFLRVKAYFDNYDWLRKRVKTIRTSHGEEGIVLLTGQRLRFIARSRSSGRGFTAHRAILDESQELPGMAIGALMPTMAAVDDPQIIYTGTVPNELNDGEHFEGLRNRGRSGEDESLLWCEHNMTSDPVQVNEILDLLAHLKTRAPTEEERALLTRAQLEGNPAIGYRLTMDHVERERRSMMPIDYARERLSLWPDGMANSAIPIDRWNAGLDEDSDFDGSISWAVDTSPNRAHSSIDIAGIRSDGKVHVEVVESRPGTNWVVPFLVEKINEHGGTLTLDPGSAAGSFIADLQEAGIEPELTSAREYAQACGRVYDLVVKGAICHIGQEELTDAVINATKKDRGDAWVWSRRATAADVTPLIAATLAIHGLPLSVSEPDVMNTIW